jgi:hypothetical protein
MLTLDRVLDVATEADPKDFEFILEVERRIVAALRIVGREDEALEIERRLVAISEVIEE